MTRIFTPSLFLLVLMMMGTAVFGQTNNGSANGTIINKKDNTPVDYASVAIKSLKDSSVVGSSNTATDGKFEFKGIAPGEYRLYVAYLGLKSVTKDFTITANGASVDLGSLAMENTGLDLQTVVIVGETPPVVVKTDTVEFNAGSFKVRENAVVEDVLKKLPGVEVAKDGSIKAQGETVTRVKVDGKEFFGNDPLLATKNLPADMIDKIQVIDQMSEQSQFTGIDDGNREKIINITTKKDKKNGVFGNSSIGYGSDDRYDVNVNVNKFKNDEQMSVIAQFNNVNKQSFGGGGGGGGRQMGGGGGGSPQGITTTNAAGLNYANILKNKTEISASYFFNKTSLYNEQTSLRQNLLGGTATTTFQENLNSTTDRLNHRFNFMVDTKIDSTTTIKIQPNFSLTNTDTERISRYTNNFGDSTTIGNQLFKTKASSPSLSNNLLIRKKFARRGRTLSLNVNTNWNDSNSDNYNDRRNYTTSSAGTAQEFTNQFNDTKSNSLGNTARLVYTEPLSKTFSLEVNYENRYNFSDSERFTYDFNPVTSRYDLINKDFTNTYENTTLTNTAGFSFNKTAKKYTWNAGLAVQHTDRENNNVTTGSIINQSFYNLTPSAQFRYTFSNSKRLRINYRGNTQQPSISQIQPIRDNTDTQITPIGNPNLRPAFTNSLRIFYNNFDYANYRSLFVFLNANQTFNAFGNSTTKAEGSGKLNVQPVNVDGVYAINAGSYVGLPIIPGNKLNINVNLNGSYGRGVNFTNAIKNITNDMSVTNGYKLVSAFEKFDFTAGINGTINRSTYSANPGQNTTYYTLNPTLDISYLLPGAIRIAADVDYFTNTGRGEDYDSKYTLLNAYTSKQFFKNRGTFKFAVNDILNQNQGILRTSSNNTITDINYNVLKRYFLVSFTYSLNRIGGKNIPGENKGPGQGGQRGQGGGRMRM